MGSSLPEVEKDFSPALLQNLQVLLSSQDRESAQIQLTQVRDWPRESPCPGSIPTCTVQVFMLQSPAQLC